MSTGSAAERAGQGERVVAPAVPLRVLPARGNLPVALTSFVGRERELAEAERLLGATRLLTLTGAGGCGKTRLALAVAAEMDELAQFEDGVWWVGLAGLQDGALLPQTLLSALELPEDPVRDAEEHLADLLAPRELLLVLDNCEHLVVDCQRLVPRFLQLCPDLTVLCTSRESLAVAGETIWSVAPLRLPEGDRRSAPDVVAASEAAQLFLTRAGSAVPGFALTPDNAAAVAEICRRVDGIPLALELAAAWVKFISPRQIAERLSDCFRLLTRGRAEDLSHHQTLRAAVDWSFELLSEPERALFRRLAVFRGGLSLAGAEAVASGAALEPGDTLDLLFGLVEKSMLEARLGSGEQETRFRLLEPLRQYAAERLEQAGEADDARRRHLAYYVALAERAEPELTGRDQARWLDGLGQEHENLRSAMAWGLESEDAEAALRAAAGLRWFWLRRNHTVEGLSWCERALDRCPDASAALRAKALNAAGTLAWRQSRCALARSYYEGAVTLLRRVGDDRGAGLIVGNLGIVAVEEAEYAAAEHYFGESLAAAERFGDVRGQANGHLNLGGIAFNRGEHQLARAHFEHSRDLFAQVGDTWGVASVQNNLGLLAIELGEFEDALVGLDRALAIRRDLEEVWGVADTLCNIATASLELGRLAEARRALEESLTIWEPLENRRGLAFALEGMGCLCRLEGDLDQAQAHLARSIALWKDTGDRRNTAMLLDEFGHLALARDDPVEAVRLFAASSALVERLGVVLPPYRELRRAEALALRVGLAGNGLEATWAEGAALTEEEAVARALEPSMRLASRSVASPPTAPSRQAARRRFGGLTAREREVAALLVLGRANDEIAAELTVVVKTVEKHVGNILTKLGFDNRAQVAAWAVAHGLAEAPDDLNTLAAG